MEIGLNEVCDIVEGSSWAKGPNENCQQPT